MVWVFGEEALSFGLVCSGVSASGVPGFRVWSCGAVSGGRDVGLSGVSGSDRCSCARGSSVKERREALST